MPIRTILLGTASLAAFANVASAQTIASADQEIIVTAQLREQDPVDVPIALSAMQGAEMERLGVQDFEDLARFIPGFEVQNQSPNNPAIVMRGITSDDGDAYGEPRVSMFQDGVSISKSRGSYVELFDIDRVEVAKGPQSTLYGRGALIGAVNIIQNKADPSGNAMAARVSYGNYNAILAEGMGNVALSDTAALRIAARVRKRDGYTENLLDGQDFNSVDTAAVRASAHFGTEAFSIDLIGNYQNDQQAGTGFKSIRYRPTDPVTGAVLGDLGRNSGAALAPGAGFEGGKPLGLNREVGGVTGIVNWELNDAVKLTSITAWRKFDSLEVFDADGISLPIITVAEEAKGEQFSQELRLTYESQAVTAFVGASYFSDENSARVPSQFDERVAVARFVGALNGGGLIAGRPASDPAPMSVLTNPLFLAGALQGAVAATRPTVAFSPATALGIANNLKAVHSESYTNYSKTQSFDLFGDVTWHISERFEIGAGVRYTHDDKTSGYSGALPNGRSILGGTLYALTAPGLSDLQRAGILQLLATPGAATIPPSVGFPLPLIGLGLQPTAGNGGLVSRDRDSGGFTWRVTARFAPSDDSSIYATYARGRRPEVFEAVSPSTPFGTDIFNTLDAETVDSFEVGAKLAKRGFAVDGAFFYQKYSNFQTTVQSGTNFVTVNAGEAEAYGFEGSVRWAATDWLQLFASYAYNHNRFTTGARNGNRFRLSPDHSAAVGGTASFDAGDDTVIDFTPSLTWQSKVFFDDDNDLPALQQPPASPVADNVQDEFQKGYALVNARLGYGAKDRSWRVEAFVDNVFDQHYVRDAGNTGDNFGLATFVAGPPRMYGVSASFKFGGK